MIAAHGPIAIGDVVNGERVVWIASDGSGFQTERTDYPAIIRTN